MAELLIPNQRVAGSIPVRVSFFWHAQLFYQENWSVTIVNIPLRFLSRRKYVKKMRYCALIQQYVSNTWCLVAKSVQIGVKD